MSSPPDSAAGFHPSQQIIFICAAQPGDNSPFVCFSAAVATRLRVGAPAPADPASPDPTMGQIASVSRGSGASASPRAPSRGFVVEILGFSAAFLRYRLYEPEHIYHSSCDQRIHL